VCSEESQDNLLLLWQRDILRILKKARVPHQARQAVIAVSGGADSMGLLHLCSNLGAWRFIVAHIRHGIREDDHFDAAFVQEEAKRLGMPVVVRTIDGLREQAQCCGSLEAAARHGRYACLEQISLENASPLVLTAHTRDDEVETIFLRLARGTWPGGLRGIPKIRPIRKESPVMLVRPILHLGRVELRAALKSQGIEWREDPSNTSMEFLRNRMRQQLLPALQAHPSGRAMLSTCRKIIKPAARIHKQVEKTSLHILEQSHQKKAGCEWLPREIFRKNPKVIQLDLIARLLRMACNQTATMVNPDTKQLERIAHLARSNMPFTQINIQPNITVYCEHPWLVVSPAHAQLNAYEKELYFTPDQDVEIAEGFRLKTRNIQMNQFDLGAWQKRSCWHAAMDMDKIGPDLKMRCIIQAETYEPINGQGATPLRNVLNTAGYPHILRKLPFVLANKDALWIPGGRIAQHIAVTPVTQRVLLIESEGIQEMCGKDANHYFSSIT